MQIAIALYDGFTALDAIGPYQVLVNLPGAEVVLCAERTGTVTDDNGVVALQVDHAFDQVIRPAVVVVPGGMATRALAVDGAPVVEWIRTVHRAATWTTSVCTGALLLGAAGVLTGRPATTHWTAMERLAGFGAVPTSERVVVDGSVATAAGVSAGIDLALTLAGTIAGPEVAQAIQLGIEYDPQPPFDAGAPWKADPGVRDLVLAVSRAAEEARGG